METKEFRKQFGVVLKSLGFKKYKSFWIRRGKEVSELVWLQRSYYSRLYYLHYQYLINDLNLEDILEGGHADAIICLNELENKELKKVCDLENEMSDQDRDLKLNILLNKMLKGKEGVMDSEKKLYAYLVNAKGILIMRPVVDYLLEKYNFDIPEKWKTALKNT